MMRTWCAICRNKSIPISTSKHEGRGGRVIMCLSYTSFTNTSFLYVGTYTYVVAFDVSRAIARERQVSNKLAALRTRRRALFPRKVPRVSHKRASRRADYVCINLCARICNLLRGHVQVARHAN